MAMLDGTQGGVARALDHYFAEPEPGMTRFFRVIAPDGAPALRFLASALMANYIAFRWTLRGAPEPRA